MNVFAKSELLRKQSTRDLARHGGRLATQGRTLVFLDCKISAGPQQTQIRSILKGDGSPSISHKLYEIELYSRLVERRYGESNLAHPKQGESSVHIIAQQHGFRTSCLI